MMQNNTGYRLEQPNEAGFIPVTFEEGPLKGYTFTFGGVRFIEESDGDDTTNMLFDYNCTSHDTLPDGLTAIVEKVLGDFIVSAIEQMLETNSLIYAGGTE